MIFAVALLVLGPKRLPDMASGLGKAIRDFRRATRDLQDQIQVDDEVRRPIQELRAALRDEPPPPPPFVPSALAVPSATLAPAEATTPASPEGEHAADAPAPTDKSASPGPGR